MMRYDMEWIKTELGGLYGSEVINELSKLIALYEIYDGPGQYWQTEDEENAKYRPTQLITNYVKKLIKAESRFMAGRAPELRINADAADKDAASELEQFVARTLDENKWQRALICGVRDCFIGKRVALCLSGAPGRGCGCSSCRPPSSPTRRATTARSARSSSSMA